MRGTRKLVALLLTGALVTACGGEPKPAGNGEGKQEDAGSKVAATITAPAADAKDVPASSTISFTTQNADKASVELKDAAGEVVEGALQSDGKTWLPSGALDYA